MRQDSPRADVSKDALLRPTDIALIHWRGATYASWRHFVRALSGRRVKLEDRQRTALSGIVSIENDGGVELYQLEAAAQGFILSDAPLAAIRRRGDA